MKELIEDYQRRLKTVQETIKPLEGGESRAQVELHNRLNTKASEYRTFIAELQRSYYNYINQRMGDLIQQYNNDASGGGSGGTLRALIMLTIELAADMGLQVDVDYTLGMYTVKTT